jgi:hypothetical protein
MSLGQHLSKGVQEALLLLLPQPTKGSNVGNKIKILIKSRNIFSAQLQRGKKKSKTLISFILGCAMLGQDKYIITSVIHAIKIWPSFML